MCDTLERDHLIQLLALSLTVSAVALPGRFLSLILLSMEMIFRPLIEHK